MTDIQLTQSANVLRMLFKEQVERDNQQFSINSIYLPNPLFTTSPKYCLIAMEPSLIGKTPEAFQAWVNRGFVNFVYSENDLILHYCAYTFLCRDSFSYQITDISKGAMNTTLANSQRNKRYTNWLSVLKQELAFFNNPRLIAVGGTARDFLVKKDFQLLSSIMHYSQNNCARFGNYYLQHSKKSLTNDIHIRLREFTTKILAKVGYTNELKTFILNKVFNKELSTWKKGLLLNYMDKFSEIEN